METRLYLPNNVYIFYSVITVPRAQQLVGLNGINLINLDYSCHADFLVQVTAVKILTYVKPTALG